MRTINAGSLDKIGPSTLAAIYSSDQSSMFRTNMVVSANGSFVDDNGSSRLLSGPEDMRVFNFLRSQADVVLVGASTAQSEKYGQINIRDEFVEFARKIKPQLAVVSLSLDLWSGARMFNEPGFQPLIFTRASDDEVWQNRFEHLRGFADVVALSAPDDTFLNSVVLDLGQRDLTHVLCEGGPRLLSSVLAADLVDDVCLTQSNIASKRPPDEDLLSALSAFETQYEIITEQFTFSRSFAPENA